jgi:hypothetical protein
VKAFLLSSDLGAGKFIRFTLFAEGFVDEKQQRRIEEIMERVDCPHDFRCYVEGVEGGGGIGGLSENGFIECLQEKPWECGFSMPFAN